MDLTPHVERLRYELGIAAAAGGDDARALAERLTAPLESAVRLVLLEALSDAADEITREMAPGSVEMRLRGREPGFAVTPAPAEDAPPAPGGAADALGGGIGGAAPAPDVEEGAMTRINLRLPDSLKARVEEAAGRERLSVNAWLVRAATSALTPGDRDERRSPRRNARGGQNLTGWVR
ncbi:hypothetical protein [Pseudonocardia sp. MH-G8]|uniref:hypothetical protein n=1 Tax=Pseudonocardia sp. MH-G8 TaxID=1854588 RepID=UPI000BA01B7A|nr:hypothetical protein [Pseudonocardia sp. MH-G8]OZM76640.1 hypothetical protein CFP66_39700 [Pseudonocardia sp. MH-G8]